MVDNFSAIIAKGKENGKLIFKNSGIKTISKNNLQIPFNDIHYIDLSGNKFTGIPDVVTEFICLQVLLCSHNMIRCLPSNINNISYLETLDLSCNHLTSLHPSVCKLLCLKVLVISSNRLMSLPTNIGRLSSLEELDVSCNSLTCLPEELSSLNRLRYLNLRHNKLLDLPTHLHKLELEMLDLSENQLTTIPSDYHRIDTLQTLNLSGNPLNFPPANVCNKGLHHIMKYLQSESKRQSNRKLSNLSTQNSIDYTIINGCCKAESLPFEINGIDCDRIATNNVPRSKFEFDFDVDSTNVYEDSPSQGGDNGEVDTATDGELKRVDLCHQPRRSSTSTLPSPVSTLDSLYSRNLSSPTLSPIEENCKQIEPTQIKKQRNGPTNRNTPTSESPNVYRSSRIVSKTPTTSTANKSRQSSVPTKERVTQMANSSNQEIEVTSQCVVVVDSSTTESRNSSARSVHNQSNNSNCSATASNRFIKNVSASPLRVVRPKFVDTDFDRKNSIKDEIKSPQLNGTPNTVDANHKFQERINKFHKIIEAQLHVHINPKNLSEELSNGIYLCHLANILVPHSIPTVHTPSPGQQDLGKQKSKRNLDNFLETCRRNGVPENCLFTARDVLSCNPIGLLHMAESVDALIHSIRTKRSRPSLDYRTSSNRSVDHIDWHGVLSNPQSLSQRSVVSGSARSSVSSYRTVSRPSKSTQRIVTNSKSHSDEIVHYSSEV